MKWHTCRGHHGKCVPMSRSHQMTAGPYQRDKGRHSVNAALPEWAGRAPRSFPGNVELSPRTICVFQELDLYHQVGGCKRPGGRDTTAERGARGDQGESEEGHACFSRSDRDLTPTRPFPFPRVQSTLLPAPQETLKSPRKQLLFLAYGELFASAICEQMTSLAAMKKAARRARIS